MIRPIKLYGTTDETAGTLSVTMGFKVTGLLKGVEWIDGDFADGVGAVLSVVRDDNAADKTLLTLTNANNDAWYFPMVTANDGTGGAIATEYVYPIVNGRLKLSVTSGGNAKSGGAIVYVEV